MPIRKVKDLKLEYNGKKAEKRVEVFTDKNQTSIEIELKKYPDVMKIDGKLAIRKDVMENPLSISSFDPENPICPEGTKRVQVGEKVYVFIENPEVQAEIESQMQELYQEIEDLKAELQARTQGFEELQTRLKKLQEDYNTTLQVKSNLASRNQELLSENREYQERIEKLEAENEGLYKKIEELERRLREYEEIPEIELEPAEALTQITDIDLENAYKYVLYRLAADYGIEQGIQYFNKVIRGEPVENGILPDVAKKLLKDYCQLDPNSPLYHSYLEKTRNQMQNLQKLPEGKIEELKEAFSFYLSKV